MKNKRPKLCQFCPSDNRDPILILGQYEGFAPGKIPGWGIEARLCLRPEYQRWFCQACHRIFPEDVFKLPLDDRAIIKARPGRHASNDNVLLFHEQYLELCKRLGVQGLEYKQVGTRPWYAVRCTRVIPLAEEYASLLDVESCPACGRTSYRHSKRTAGLRMFDYVELTGLQNTVFTVPVHTWCQFGREPWRYMLVTGYFLYLEFGRLLEKEARSLRLSTPGLSTFGSVA